MSLFIGNNRTKKIYIGNPFDDHGAGSHREIVKIVVGQGIGKEPITLYNHAHNYNGPWYSVGDNMCHCHCNCGLDVTIEHDYGYYEQEDETYHKKICYRCNGVELEDHSFYYTTEGVWDSDKVHKQCCEYCGYCTETEYHNWEAYNEYECICKDCGVKLSYEIAGWHPD